MYIALIASYLVSIGSDVGQMLNCMGIQVDGKDQWKNQGIEGGKDRGKEG
jgi:hypothetical protein